MRILGSIMVATTTYLCGVGEGSRFGMRGTTLVLYLTDFEDPQPLLVNPSVVGYTAAAGTWFLVAWRAESRMAFYSHQRAGSGEGGSGSGLSEGDAADYLDV
jgi:hypothetical protein